MKLSKSRSEVQDCTKFKKFDLDPFDNEIIIRMLQNKNYYKDTSLLINSPDNNGQTAFHIACFYNNVEAVKMMLPFKPNLFLEDMKGRRPIALTCSDEIKSLLYFHMVAKFNHARYERSKEYAAGEDSNKVIENETKTDLNLLGTNIYAPIHKLPKEIQPKYQQIRSILICNNPDDLETLKVMIERGLDPLMENQDLQNVVHCAVFCENLIVLKYLLDAENKYSLVEDDNEDEQILSSSNEQNQEPIAPMYVLNSLLALDKPTKTHGYTPLHAA